MDTKVVLTDDLALENIVLNALKKYGVLSNGMGNVKLYSIHSVAKKLGMAHKTVKKLCTDGQITTTSNNRITEAALNEYLKTQK
jgi:hypothetical protein